MADRPNVLFILTDQERYFPSWPTGYELPGRQRLQELGATFTNHQITSNVCTPSRSTIYTGHHIQRTTVFDNVNFPWSNDLPGDLPTIGHRLRDIGYYSAYLGKWHLSRALDTTDVYAGANPDFGDILDGYGFSDFVGPGDVIGMTHGGYRADEMIGAAARRWLRTRAQDLADDDTPWFLAVNLVNPHDVMMFDTDRPGEVVQTAGPTMVPVAPAPPSALYASSWDIALPETRHEPWDAPGRPPAHGEYQEARRFLTGLIPDEDDRWKALLDYYLNCIRDCDRQVHALLQELEDQGMLDGAVVIQTSDHGELGGAHQMSGKGTTAYREQDHVPLVIKHPDGPQGSTVDALTSHVDLVPTILGCVGQEPSDVDDLPGRDITPALFGGSSTDIHAVRDATLYAFNMFTVLDADFIGAIANAKVTGQQPETPPQFDFSKRGAIRSVFDGRHKFSRYFSPLEHDRPETFHELTSRNDLELFDLDADPTESVNLAADPQARKDLILGMNDQLNRVIDEEVGLDDGSFLPTGTDHPWEVERWDA